MFALYELINLFPDSFEPKFRPKLDSLYLFLKSSKPITEEEGAVRFLNGNKKHFNKLKNELKETLCAYLITNPLTWVNNEQKALFDECYKSFAAYKILLASGSRKAAIERARKLFPKFCKLEIHGLIYLVAIDLQFHYSCIAISPKQAKYYTTISEEQIEFLKAEVVVRKQHSLMGYICNTRNNFPPSIVNQLNEAAQLCMRYLSLNSTTLNRLIYNVIVSRFIVVYDYENIIYYCDLALKSFVTAHPNYVSLRFDYLQKKIPALVALHKFEEAKIIAKEAGQMMPKGSFNWHVALIRRVLICFHMADYQEAYDLFKAHGKYHCNYQVLAEYWKIIKGFIYCLILTGRIQNYTEERFLLGKFLNETPIVSKDKSGNNINLVIIQILIQMQRGEYGKIIDRSDSLREYIRSYTRNPETARANIFLTMIQKMESASFHRAGTERKTERLLRKLNETPLALGQNLGIEIIPYPVLWEMILESLENKFRTLKNKATIKKTK